MKPLEGPIWFLDDNLGYFVGYGPKVDNIIWLQWECISLLHVLVQGQVEAGEEFSLRREGVAATDL